MKKTCPNNIFIYKLVGPCWSPPHLGYCKTQSIWDKRDNGRYIGNEVIFDLNLLG